MMGRRTRQSRLSTGEGEAALAERVANWRVLRKTFLSATALSSFSFCNVKPFIERMLSAAGLDAETPQMRAGAAAHERLQGALVAAGPATQPSLREALPRGRFAFEVERAFKDERRMLRGIADLAYAAGGRLSLIELKNTGPPAGPDPVWGASVWHEHGVQIQFYALLAHRELGAVPRLALAYLKGASKDVVLDRLAATRDPETALESLFASGARVEPQISRGSPLERLIRDFRKAERRELLPSPSHGRPAACQGCRVRSWCPRRLDQPGRFEPVDAESLPPP